MKSIRVNLLLSLLATITLVNFIALLHGYQSSMEKAQALFDNRLIGTTRLIASVNSEQVQSDYVDQHPMPHSYFQIFDVTQNNLLIHSHNAPSEMLGHLNEGFSDVNFAGYRWRQYVFEDQHLQRWIVVGERLDIRYFLAEDVILESLLPIVMVIPLAALIIWFAVGLGIKPLNQLAMQIRGKKANDLSPVYLENVPRELETVIDNTNDLLTRLSDAFDREQRLTSDAAHELRTPISVLKVHLHNLKTRIGGQDKDLQLLQESVERMGHLVEQILALYRTSPDQVAVKFESVNIYSFAQAVIADEYDQFEKKQQQISLNGDSACIQGNAFALETMIKNLLSNANKYTPVNGQILVEINSTSQTVNIVVEDSGPGIPKQQQQRVFERFYRVGGDQHGSGEVGCGLGLTIVQHIVAIHKGRIQLAASTHFNSGLKVTVELPR